MLSCLRTLATKRTPWILVAGFAVFLVVFAHAVFQKWLFMEPCEQCVYIRFAFILVALGALIIALNPRALWLTVPGIALSLYGAMYGLICSLRLSRIHAAMHDTDSDALFGLTGCSTTTHYPLGLPLDVWFPDWFAASGECGIDTPVVPPEAVLSNLQSFWINLYNEAGGWYLIPTEHWLNMAQCCAVFSVLFLLVIVAFGTGLALRGPSRT
ncbi:MAG: protein-disulfide oxidoreductase DsbI [Sutterella sp.]|nr:protein-disulfide oxidoreductase DsbI [Sutterella sp.]